MSPVEDAAAVGGGDAVGGAVPVEDVDDENNDVRPYQQHPYSNTNSLGLSSKNPLKLGQKC